MSYLGKSPPTSGKDAGASFDIDDISGGFNSSTTAFNRLDRDLIIVALGMKLLQFPRYRSIIPHLKILIPALSNLYLGFSSEEYSIDIGEITIDAADSS